MIYLDNHSTTRCDPRVVEQMLPYFSEHYGNAASRSHLMGRDARDATERARSAVAKWIGASPKEVLFTSGATESNNLAIQGAVRATGRRDAHVITVGTEHPSVLDVCDALRRQGAEITCLSVDSNGLVDPDDVGRALRDDTALVSVMRVNNETGVQQPIQAIGALCRDRGVPFHVDAAQAVYSPIDVSRLPIDVVSLSAHKMYGPKGAGALYVRHRPMRPVLAPVVFGGGHERGLRSGTLAVPLIVGMGCAASLATGNDDEADEIRGLRDRLLEGLQSRVDGITVHGSMTHRAPQNLNVSVPGVEAVALLMAVRDTVCLSTGSACASERLQASSVLQAMGVASEEARTSIRFGLGRFTSEADIDEVLVALEEGIECLRL